MKRTDYISWDQYFMGIAILSGHRSKDPSTQVGACIVDNDKKIIGVGYNGLPTGCCDNEFPWTRDGELHESKYAYVCHAEANAILNVMEKPKGSTIYVSLFPCNECAKLIIQSGISKIIYLSDKYSGTPGDIASKKMLDSAGIIYEKLNPEIEELVLNFKV